MGCLTGLAALLALAIPVSICRVSLAGALGLIAVFTVVALAGARRIGRRGWYPRIGVLAAAYAGVVVAVHFT